jgi:signal transduction histidine kinase
VAHEVKNPLAMILAGTEFLLSQSERLGDPAVEPVLRDIRSAVERASAVVHGLLNYSAATELEPKPADLDRVIAQSLLLVQHALHRGHIRVEKELVSGLPPLLLDVPKVEQVLINLLINAIDAMPEGGTLTIRTQRKQLTASDESVGHRQTDPLRVGESVVLVSVQDTGPGFSAEHLKHVFDPFFTTKPTGKGTGLGLAVSKTIISLHGGTIWVGNNPRGGAVVTVVLRSATS